MSSGLEGCGFGPCKHSVIRGGHGCDMCDRVAKIEPLEPCGRELAEDTRCTLFKGHPSWVACRGTKRPKKEAAAANPERDGTPTLAAAKERRHPMWEKRHREGPHRGSHR